MPDPLPLSIIEHYAYCPRQAALIHVEGQWSANVDTARGEVDHAAVDRAVRSETRDGVVTWLSLPVWNDRLQVAGLCDAVELVGGAPTPVEHKPRHVPIAHSAAAQQVAAQALCLEAMWGCRVPQGVLFTRADRRRHVVTIDEHLRVATERTIEACHILLADRQLPLPVNDRRCQRCSLREACGVSLPSLDGVAVFADQEEGDW